jgi:hypothetical protein
MQCFRTCHWIHGSCPRFQEVVQASQKSSSLHNPPKNVCVQLLWNGRHDTIPVMCVCILRRNTYMHTYCVYIISIYIMYCQHVSSMPAPMFEVRISLGIWNHTRTYPQNKAQCLQLKSGMACGDFLVHHAGHCWIP